MPRSSLEIPLAVIAAGCIICLFSFLGNYSTVVDTATSTVMFKIGLTVGLAGGVILLVTTHLRRERNRKTGS